MATPSSENELIELERQYWQALQANDFETVSALTDFPCLITGPQGVGAIDREAYRQMMGSANYTLERFELGDVQARMINDDVGVVAYRVSEDFTLDGKPLHLEAVDASTWIRRDGRWACAQHAEAIQGDPWGRDKAAQRGSDATAEAESEPDQAAP